MRRVRTLAIVALMAYAIVILPHVTAVRLADAVGSDAINIDTGLNLQPLAGCFLFERFDSVTPPVLPAGWAAINAIDPDGIFWQTSNSGAPTPPAHFPPNAAWVNDPAMISDKYLYSPSGTIDPEASSMLTFWNNYALEDGFDGGVLEISVDGGAFQDILTVAPFIQGGYNGTISTCCGNPLSGRQAWTGNSGGFIQTIVSSLPHGHPIVLRWRMGSDLSGSSEGWRVDDIFITCERGTPSPTPTPKPTPISRTTPAPRPRPTPLPRPTPS